MDACAGGHEFSNGLIEDGHAWMDIIKARNLQHRCGHSFARKGVNHAVNHGFSDEAIERIRGVLGQCDAVDSAVLYGSHAKGTFKPGSDVDLTDHEPLREHIERVGWVVFFNIVATRNGQ